MQFFLSLILYHVAVLLDLSYILCLFLNSGYMHAFFFKFRSYIHFFVFLCVCFKLCASIVFFSKLFSLYSPAVYSLFVPVFRFIFASTIRTLDSVCICGFVIDFPKNE